MLQAQCKVLGILMREKDTASAPEELLNYDGHVH